MTDIEYLLYDEVCAALTAQFPALNMSGVYVAVPKSFPHLSFAEENAADAAEAMQFGQIDYGTDLSFTANIYSVDRIDPKKEAKAIANALADIMRGKGFRMTFCEPLPNADRGVYRIMQRFEGKQTMCGDTAFIAPR